MIIWRTLNTNLLCIHLQKGLYLMPKVIKCPNDHYYDGFTFEECPHCKKNNPSDKISGRYKAEVSKYALEYIENQCKACQDTEEHTVIISDTQTDFYFVTGWLVCLTGPYRGHSFSLYQGITKLGIGKNSYISTAKEIPNEELYCTIIYDRDKNDFHLANWQCNSLYLNGIEINCTIELLSGDNIKINDTEFEFIAYCQAKRKWDVDEVNYENE